MEWIDPQDAPAGLVLLGWIHGTMLPSFKLVSKHRKTGRWYLEEAGKGIPQEWIAGVCLMPKLTANMLAKRDAIEAEAALEKVTK